MAEARHEQIDHVFQASDIWMILPAIVTMKATSARCRVRKARHSGNASRKLQVWRAALSTNEALLVLVEVLEQIS